MDSLRKTLDHLMGADRDLPLKEKLSKQIHFDDPSVCKYYLIGFCPHELFRNTKSDLRECQRRHDIQFKMQFDNDPHKEEYQQIYEDGLMDFLETLIADVDNKMKRCAERIEAPNPEKDMNKEVIEKITEIDDKIAELVEKAEKFEELGLFDDCEAAMRNIEQLKAQKEEQLTLKEHPLMMKEKQMKICEICGALQSSVDNEKRLQTHVEGKLHSGYLKIREYLALLRRRKLERKHKTEEEKERMKKKIRESEERRERKRREKKEEKYRHHSNDRHYKDKESKHNHHSSNRHDEDKYKYKKEHHSKERHKSRSRNKRRHSESRHKSNSKRERRNK